MDVEKSVEYIVDYSPRCLKAEAFFAEFFTRAAPVSRVRYTGACNAREIRQ